MSAWRSILLRGGQPVARVDLAAVLLAQRVERRLETTGSANYPHMRSRRAEKAVQNIRLGVAEIVAAKAGSYHERAAMDIGSRAALESMPAASAIPLRAEEAWLAQS